MDVVLREARAEAKNASWTRPPVGPGARSRSSSAGARLVLEPIPPEAVAAVTAKTVATGSEGSADLSTPSHGRAVRSTTARRPSSGPPGAAPLPPAADGLVPTPKGPAPSRAARPPVPIAPPSVSVGDHRAPPAPIGDEAARAEEALGAEEAQLLQELEDLEARLSEKEDVLKGIASREAALRDEFLASQGEARQLSLQVAELERDLANSERDLANNEAEASVAVSTESDSAHNDHVQRARLAMGLTGTS